MWSSLIRKVITRPFNEAVLAEIAKDIDPENPEEQGKTLIYAVDDQHADMIVDILKNIYSEYGVDNDAIMKITGSVGGGNPKKVQEAIKRFKNETLSQHCRYRGSADHRNRRAGDHQSGVPAPGEIPYPV